MKFLHFTLGVGDLTVWANEKARKRTTDQSEALKQSNWTPLTSRLVFVSVTDVVKANKGIDELS